MVARGEIWWADLPEPSGSMPGYRRPILIIQSDKFNESKIATIVGIAITSNMALAGLPGNVTLLPRQSGLGIKSVANVTQIVTANKVDLLDFAGRLPEDKMEQIEQGLRLVLDL
jgi:mRNA interferase MazF